MKNIFFTHCLILINSLTLNAQSTYVGGLFPTIDHTGKINKRFDYSLYYFGAFPIINIKSPDNSKHPDFLLFYSEQAFTYNVNPKFSFTGSYVYQRENVTKDNYSNENRVHIQATYKHSTKTINLKHRLRFDNRFVHNRTTGETPYTHRLRYLIGLDFPIKSKKNNLYFTAYEEAFFNTFKNAGAAYEENWAYAAIGVKLNDKNKIETGPLYITWNTGTKNWFHQFYLQFTWISYVDYTRNK
ncbi:MAG: DUF2490 domain-containing protein [Saprospiraceae bacterium]|nr:DUF2490 domain-containing protein [Saprospiraceae bacterium]